ncbi:hypothetical protein ACFW5W_07085 [Streptomyces sp. NPDC058783]|uniref:hypothetical protein n=1 Tax=Streptomyces sp. NPDC058783 TaxID=3346633 RepID=UPI0036A08A1D
MSSTRRANKRARLARRAENDAMRDARRETLLVLLSRAQRGRPLSTSEADLLRIHVEAEIREGDAARASERGQQRAMEEHRQRVEAADEAIRELEQRAEQAEAQAKILGETGLRYQQRAWDAEGRARDAEQAEAERYKADYLNACKTIADMHAAATGRTGEGPERGVVEDVGDVRARMLAAEERAAQAEHQVSILDAVDQGRAHGARRIMDERDQAQQRAEQAEARLAEEQKAHDDHRRILATALHAREDHEWPALIDWAAQAHEWASSAAVKADRKRAATAEGRLALIRDMADAWEQRLPATIRTATAAEAVRNAANGDDRPVMFGVAPTAGAGTIEFAEQERARFERLYTRETVRADKAEARAQEAEEQAATQLNRARMWRQKAIETDDRADRFEAAWQSARQRAAKQRALADSRQKRLHRRARRILDLEQQAEQDDARLTEQRLRADYRGAQLADALRRADTYRAAWHSARDRARKATRRGDIWKAKAHEIEQDRDRLAATLPLTVMPAQRPEVITDRATIRNTLDEPEPGAPCPCNGVCHECDDSLCDACAPARP